MRRSVSAHVGRGTKVITAGSPPAVSGNTIASIAKASIGHPYVWGVWDCSGAVNHWLSQAGCAIPGYAPGKFKGPPPHGPVVVSYVAWSGASTVKGPPQAGDLCVWAGVAAGGHIGIAVDGTHMVSALNSQLGTALTPIKGNGPAGAPLMFRRLHSVQPGGGNVLPPGGLAGCAPAATTGLAIIGGIAWVTTKFFRH